MGDPADLRPKSDAVEIVSGPIDDLAAEYGNEDSTSLLPPRSKGGEQDANQFLENLVKPEFWKSRPYLFAPLLIFLIFLLVSVTERKGEEVGGEMGAPKKASYGNECLHEAQVAYFPKRVNCEFQAHSRWAGVQDWLSHRRNETKRKGSHSGSKPTCMVMAVTDAGSEWFERMRQYDAFETCYAFIYTDIDHFTPAKRELEGTSHAYVKKVGPGFRQDLDGEFSTLQGVFPADEAMLMLEGFDGTSQYLKGFSGGLSSGRVGAIIWDRIGGFDYQRTMEEEVEYVSNFGYSVFVVGGGLGETGVGFLHRITLDAPYIRVDGYYWDKAFVPKDSRLNVTLMGVRKGSRLEPYLREDKGLCRPPGGKMSRRDEEGNVDHSGTGKEGGLDKDCRCRTLPEGAKDCPIPKGAKAGAVYEKRSGGPVWEEQGYNDPLPDYRKTGLGG